MEALKADVRDIFTKLVKDPTFEVYKFPSNYGTAERKVIHNLATQFNLKTKSEGKGSARHVVVFRKGSKSSVKEEISLISIEQQTIDLCHKYLSNYPLDEKVALKLQPIDDPSSSPYARQNPLGTPTSGNSLSSNLPAVPRESCNFSLLPARQRLPIWQSKSVILRAIRENRVVIIEGSTGCGKTTQIPQFILDDASEYQYPCRIICTLPRRIAVVTVSERVCAERGEPMGSTVGYQIRLEKRTSCETLLTFCTTGILLHTLLFSGSEFLTNVTHILMDEFHERDVLNDFALILVRDILIKSPHIKLVMMSATIDISMLERYFRDVNLDCTVVTVPGGLYRVHNIFLDNILRFMPIANLTRYTGRVEQTLEEFTPAELDDMEETCCRRTEIDYDLIVDLVLDLLKSYEKGAILVFLPGYKDISFLKQQILRKYLSSKVRGNIAIHVLHSKMQGREQKMAFTRRNNTRKIILATNIAETSITIEDVSYVIDTGKSREVSYSTSSGSLSLRNEWISHANVTQRAGRAGRTKEGVCFHLYTKRTMDTIMPEYQLAEIFRQPLQALCLHAKLSAPPGLSIMEFFKKAIEPPATSHVDWAVSNLKAMDALDPFENMTFLGYYLQKIPIDPKFGKAILYAIVLKVLDPVLIICSILYLGNIFTIPATPVEKTTVAENHKKWSCGTYSDHIAYYIAYLEWSKLKSKPGSYEWCEKHYINHQNMSQVPKLVEQLKVCLEKMGLLNSPVNYCSNGGNSAIVKAAITAGLDPNIAVSKDLKFLSTEFVPMVTVGGTSILKHNTKTGNMGSVPSRWVIYEDLHETKGFNQLRICTVISELTIALFAGPARLPQNSVSVISENVDDLTDPIDLNDDFEDIRDKCDKLNLNDSSKENNKDIAVFHLNRWLKLYMKLDNASLLRDLRTKLNILFENWLEHPKNPFTPDDAALIKTLVDALTKEEESLGLLRDLSRMVNPGKERGTPSSSKGAIRKTGQENYSKHTKVTTSQNNTPKPDEGQKDQSDNTVSTTTNTNPKPDEGQKDQSDNTVSTTTNTNPKTDEGQKDQSDNTVSTTTNTNPKPARRNRLAIRFPGQDTIQD